MLNQLNHYLLVAAKRFPYAPITWFLDPFTWHQEMPVGQIFLRTQRYRLAGLGFTITENEERILALKDKHKGERAFVLGNGPSLNKCDLTKLKDEVTFAVNGIFLNYDNMGYHPTYYVVEDTFVAEDRASEINSYKGPQLQFFGNYLRYTIADKPDNIWLNVQIDYRGGQRFPHFSTNVARRLWVGGTVTYISLQLAYYMGFSEIYLIGFDHSYHIPKSAKIEGADILSTTDDPNHFHPDYFGKGYRWHDPQVDRMEKSFIRAKETFEKDDRVIKNATVGGHLEVFERVDYKSLF